MKKLLPVFFICMSLLPFLSAAQDGNTKDTALRFPFTANYSSKIQLGDQKHSVTVMEFWKDWDENTLERNSSKMHDSVMVLLSTGQVIAGKEKFMKIRQDLRNNIQTVKSTIDVWVPIYISDKNEYWVSVWGSQNTVMKDGTKNTVLLNELWRLGKDGKVTMIRQHSGAQPGTVK